MSARIVFDLDGTLIDSAPDLHGIANELLAARGLEGITLQDTRNFIGDGSAVFVARMRDARGIPDNEQASLFEAFMARYDDAVTLTRPYPGAEAALERLSRSHRLGICTNKPYQPCVAVLRHLELDRFFDTVWGGDSLPSRKPDPEPLFAAFDALGDGPRVYVGDSEVDAETARRAGVPFLLYSGGYRKSPVDKLPHTAVFDDFDDLDALVETHVRGSAA